MKEFDKDHLIRLNRIGVQATGEEEGEWERMSKKVRLMIELDSHFVALLQANLTMHGFEREQDVLHVLGIAVLGEAMGGYPEQIWQKIPPAWRPHIDIISDKREVIEETVKVP